VQRPITVGHRGASALAPENSLRAFELALEYGLDMAELDVHLSQDGELMVVHDADLLRLTGRPLRVADVRASDLRALQIPRLLEVVERVGDQLGLYVELKGPGTGAVVAALGLKNVVVGSFDTSLVAEFRAADTSTPCSVLFARAAVPEMVETCRLLDAAYAHPCFRPITPELVDGLHAAGLLVMSPHTNDHEEARHFAVLGVDVIASDDPRVLRQLTNSA